MWNEEDWGEKKTKSALLWSNEAEQEISNMAPQVQSEYVLFPSVF